MLCARFTKRKSDDEDDEWQLVSERQKRLQIVSRLPCALLLQLEDTEAVSYSDGKVQMVSENQKPAADYLIITSCISTAAKRRT